MKSDGADPSPLILHGSIQLIETEYKKQRQN